jgi:two-component SAPR family response regulator
LRGNQNQERHVRTQIVGRYRLDTNLVTTDVAESQSIIARAGSTGDLDSQAAALHDAVELYRGTLVDGSPYGWAEPVCEELRRTATDALTRLASLCREAMPDLALTVLERAITLDPYNEELYRNVMQVQIASGHRDAARRTLRLLESRLDDIDAHPSPNTFVPAGGSSRRASGGRTGAPRQFSNRRRRRSRPSSAGR